MNSVLSKCTLATLKSMLVSRSGKVVHLLNNGIPSNYSLQAPECVEYFIQERRQQSAVTSGKLVPGLRRRERFCRS